MTTTPQSAEPCAGSLKAVQTGRLSNISAADPPHTASVYRLFVVQSLHLCAAVWADGSAASQVES